MVAHLIKQMAIKDVAELWSRETRRPAGVYERALCEYRGRLTALDYDWDPTSYAVSPFADITRQQLRTFCTDNQIEPPAFWFGARVSKASDEKQCKEWLRSQVALGPKQKPKVAYYKLAKTEIDGLSERAFNRAWDATAPLEWKQRGRPKKS